MSKMSKKNSTMFQAFEWYIEPDYQHWNRIKDMASTLKSSGIDIVWLPPAYKEMRALTEEPITYDQVKDNTDNELSKQYFTAVNATGYAVYDKFDLGEFELPNDSFKTTVATKYGTKDEFIDCIDALHENDIKVLVDVVLNHMFHADAKEPVPAIKYKDLDRSTPIESGFSIEAPTKFAFPNRNGKYSTTTWDSTDFNAVSFDDENAGKKPEDKVIYLFKGKSFSKNVDKGYDVGPKENGGNKNFDYLMGSNVDMQNPPTQKKIIEWLEWYMNETEADGVRLDAVKHIDYDFLPQLLEVVKRHTQSDFFAVGEHWTHHTQYAYLLNKYLHDIGNGFTLFDVPFHMALHRASTSNGEFDMRTLYDYSICHSNPESAVTFVDNHDSQSGQMLPSEVLYWFKKHAYSIILFQEYGLPCVFYGDMFGYTTKVQRNRDSLTDYTLDFEYHKPVELLSEMCQIRKSCAHGKQVTLPIGQMYDGDLFGFVRPGTGDYSYSGLVVLLTNRKGGTVNMYVNSKYKGEYMINIFSSDIYHPEYVQLDHEGKADFTIDDAKCAVWIREKAYRRFILKEKRTEKNKAVLY